MGKGSSDSEVPRKLPLSQEELRRRVSHVRYDLKTGETLVFPPLTTLEDILAWANRVEECMTEAEIPEEQWSEAALLFIQDSSVSIEMRRGKQRHLDDGFDVWSWKEFLEVLSELLDSRGMLQKLREDHPTAVKVAGAGLVIAGGTVLGPAMVVGGLNSVGFTSTGVATVYYAIGSLATTVQSMFYGGATSGLFSICQSIGATAVSASAGTVISAVGSVVAGVGLIKNGGEGGGEDAGSPKDGEDDPTDFTEATPESSDSEYFDSPP
ncbi:hypothetical protein CVT26_014013 [Gymnopilus dilepis]|uniref:Uncharacterized protein n=1 Tax=Gymnopilus dilepis TaxID=231916 RepID=A0A409Y8H6_9AGAR|nr:hypothetical protein CVT26_014013 [Gymnopilus dilepis]